MISKACELKRKKKVKGSSLTLEQRRRTFDLVEKELSEDEALSEASRCLGTLPCQSCDICVLLCPDLCITRSDTTGEVVIPRRPSRWSRNNDGGENSSIIFTGPLPG
jgi:ferredoxin